jgi:hypothetical protein
MLEITEKDIANLGDADLRDLVARLAAAEFRSKGLPRSSVTAGGNQDAKDGGIDVRVDCPHEIKDPDFVPRPQTGFQVKKSNMQRGAIIKEMSPNGTLRGAIRELVGVSGAYVIISSQGSVADGPLAERRQAMRDALGDIPNAAQLHIDFYDRVRLAAWVNEYAGIVAWVKCRTGNPQNGWSSIGNWDGTRDKSTKTYLSDDKACMIDERSREREHLTISEGIGRLREGLRTPGRCIRLVGLSGTGKTRLVEALFEEDVGDDPLDQSIAIYTDYSEETEPTARNMARQLIAQKQRAILVLDNCNPKTHSELARLSAGESSKLSLLTVEYDFADDEPEHTDVFRLQTASPELVSEWLKKTFTDLSQVDREAIAKFSDGNFRVAGVIARTLGKGETLGSLKDRELFERIFLQRNKEDRELIQAAEDLALMYSIEGVDVSAEGELYRVSAIRGIGAQSFYEALAEMKKRGVVQSRGRFRAILPQAIANLLAARALERIPPTTFDQFCVKLTPRMLKSVSRRLGLLHDSQAVQATVVRWLRNDGPLGDLFSKAGDSIQIITNIAPVAPEAVLDKIEHCAVSHGHHQWIRLIKAIGYDAGLFDRSVDLLARWAASQSENNNLSSARNLFCEFFHIYLSGTRASPEQRRVAIRRLAGSDDQLLRKSASIALRALLNAGSFMSSGGHEFGARSRDWGWHPKINQDIWDWYEEAIALVIELETEAEARVLLASAVRGLWSYPGCREALIRAAKQFTLTQPWIEGWISCRAALRYDGMKMSPDSRAELEQLIKFLKPADLLNQARAVVINRMPGGGGWDFADGEEENGDAMKPWVRANEMAKDVGRALAQDPKARVAFVAEVLIAPHPQRTFQCGLGLAEGADDLDAMWSELAVAYRCAPSEVRKAALLDGFLCGANQRDPVFASKSLDAVVNDPELLPMLPYFQASVGIDAVGISRLRDAITRGGLASPSFRYIANGCVENSPVEDLAALVNDIASLPNGVAVALDILQMRFFSRSKKENAKQDEPLISVGRDLLMQMDFSGVSDLHDYTVGEVIKTCLRREEGISAAERVCQRLCASLGACKVSLWNLTCTVEALFETQPFVALDAFLLSELENVHYHWTDVRRGKMSAVEKLGDAVLQKWASLDPTKRFPLLGGVLPMFEGDADDNGGFSPLFMSMLNAAPDKRQFIGGLWKRVHPQGWSGSLSIILIRRKDQLMDLAKDADEQVRGWAIDAIPEIDQWIEEARKRDREGEESFE